MPKNVWMRNTPALEKLSTIPVSFYLHLAKFRECAAIEPAVGIITANGLYPILCCAINPALWPSVVLKASVISRPGQLNGTLVSTTNGFAKGALKVLFNEDVKGSFSGSAGRCDAPPEYFGRFGVC